MDLLGGSFHLDGEDLETWAGGNVTDLAPLVGSFIDDDLHQSSEINAAAHDNWLTFLDTYEPNASTSGLSLDHDVAPFTTSESEASTEPTRSRKKRKLSENVDTNLKKRKVEPKHESHSPTKASVRVAQEKVVHWPTVRSKRTKQSSPDKSRKTSSEAYSTPPTKASKSASHETFVTPPPTEAYALESFFSSPTPQNRKKKKMSVKMRFVPLDSKTRNCVAACGCNPKVELALRTSKNVSKVVAYMRRKWKEVDEIMPVGTSLHLSPTEVCTTSWTEDSTEVSCLDIWNEYGKKVNGESVVMVSYVWKAATGSPSDAQESKEEDSTPPATASDADKTKAKEDWGLGMELPEDVAIPALSTQQEAKPKKKLRRITPTLVSKSVMEELEKVFKAE